MKKIICILLAVLTLTLVSCDNRSGPTPSTTPDAPSGTTSGTEAPNGDSTTPEPVPVVFFGYVQDGKQCRIVYEDGLDSSVNATIELIANRINEFTGGNTKAVNALLPDLGTPEILIGDTGRAESDEFIAGLKYRDYGFVIEEDYVVIAGKTQDNTIRALNRFYDYIKANEPDMQDGTAGILSTHDYMRLSTYVTGEFTVGGTDIREFTIIYSDSNAEAAQLLSEGIAELTGYVLPYYKATSAAGRPVGEHEILIGNTGRAVAGDYYDGKTSKLPTSLDYIICVKDGCLIFAGGCDTVAGNAVKEFVKQQSKASPATLSLTGEIESGVGDLSYYSVYPKTEGSDVRLMSSNVYFYNFSQKRVDIMLDSYVMCSPDVLCLQEMSAQWHNSLDSGLEEFGYVQVPFVPEASLGNITATSNYTPIYYKASLYDVVASGYDQFESVKQKPDGDKSSSKSFTWSVFERKSDKLRFAVISTHLTWYSEPGQAEKYRVQDATEILAAVAMIEKTYNVPVAVMGDMNSATGNDAYNTLRSGDMDTAVRLAIKTQDANYNTWHELDAYPNQNSSMIDHIFVTAQNTTVNYYQTFVNSSVISGSDHTPIITDLTYKK